MRPNRWNPNFMDPEMLEKARASIREFGFVDPVTVRDVAHDVDRNVTEVRFEIIDGEHRWVIAKEEGIDPIPAVNLGRLSDAAAQQLTIVLNETRGQANPDRLGKLLKELMVTETKEHLLSVLPYTAQALERLTGLPTMTWEGLGSQARPTLPGQKPSAWVERTYRMPKESAEIIDQAINKIRSKDEEITEWQALEYVCADYLGG